MSIHTEKRSELSVKPLNDLGMEVKIYDTCESCMHFIKEEERTHADRYSHCRIDSLVRDRNGFCSCYTPHFWKAMELRCCRECEYWNSFEKPYMCEFGIPFSEREKAIPAIEEGDFHYPDYLTCSQFEPKDYERIILPYRPRFWSKKQPPKISNSPNFEVIKQRQSKSDNRPLQVSLFEVIDL